MNKLHVEEAFPTSMTPEVTKIGPDGAASLLGTRLPLYKLPKVLDDPYLIFVTDTTDGVCVKQFCTV